MKAKRRVILAMISILPFLLPGCSESLSDAAGEPPPSFLVKDETDIPVNNGQKGEIINVGLTSWRDLPFKTVKRQTYDYSCGSAAVATLMTYIYGYPVSEKDVFKEMFLKGDRDKIRREGFSMLDMSNYLNAQGLEAKGYKITANEIEKYKLPFIALVNLKGYNHFVVVKTLDDERVLIGDSNKGNTVLSRQDFAQSWNGLALVVVNEVSKGQASFADPKEWKFARASAPADGNAEARDIAELSPVAWQIAPKTGDILPAAMMGLVATSTWGNGS